MKYINRNKKLPLGNGRTHCTNGAYHTECADKKATHW